MNTARLARFCVVLCCAATSCAGSVVSTTVLEEVPPAAAFITAKSGMKLSTLADSTADRIRWQQALDQARRRAQGLPSDDVSATGKAAA